ncbi:MAG: hypothetical protein SOT07_02910 [Paludibacteraceae bacterium]|nr:hypothetical protein [Paludibacteraceae bacterium]
MKNYKLLPKITLWVLLIIGVIFSVMFYAGGSAGTHEVAGDFLDIPRFSDLFLTWNYILLAIVILVTLGVVIVEYFKNWKYDKKKAIVSSCVVLGFVALIALCWGLGSDAKIEIVGYEGTDNEGFMARLSDAIIYLCYILAVGTIGSMIFGLIFTRLRK